MKIVGWFMCIIMEEENWKKSRFKNIYFWNIKWFKCFLELAKGMPALDFLFARDRERATWRYSVQRNNRKFLQNIPENIFVGGLFLNKTAGCKLYQKKETRVFLFDFCEIIRNTFLQNTCKQLLLLRGPVT